MSRYARHERGDFNITYDFKVDDWEKKLAHHGVHRMGRGWEPLPEVEEWIEENGGGPWWYCSFTGSFAFHLKADAVMFKLRWK